LFRNASKNQQKSPKNRPFLMSVAVIG